MSTDKTLADVQPGGRVRLGDQALSTSEGARHYVADYFAMQLRRHDFGDYIQTELAADFACALAQHLSSQPSPGGQGVGVSISDDDRAVLQRLQDALPTAGINGWAKGVEVLERLLRDSLAARQPVGEQRAALWIQFAKNGNIQFWTKDQDRALAESFLHARPLTAFYASPQQPAQAVDLGAMPEGWRLSKKATCYQLSHGNDIVGNLVGPDAEENAAIIARVLDSRVVGNG